MEKTSEIHLLLFKSVSMPLSLSHSCLLPLESLNKYITTQIFDKNSNTFPKGNIQVVHDLGIDAFLKEELENFSHLKFCNSCGAIKETFVSDKKWYCGYCNDVNYADNSANDYPTNREFYSDLSSSENSNYSLLTSMHLFILDYCTNDQHDLKSIDFFNEQVKNVLSPDDLINFLFIFPDGNFYTVNEAYEIVSFDSKNGSNFMNCFKPAETFDWSILKTVANRIDYHNNNKKRIKRQLPLDILYNAVLKSEECFIKILYHPLGPVTSKDGKIVNSEKKHLLRKFDDNQFNRESYKLSKTAYKYFNKQFSKWASLSERNIYTNFALFGCALDDIGVMELTPLFKLYNFVDSYDSSLNIEKLKYALNNWHYEDSFKLVEFESFSSSEFFNISGIWGESKNYQKVRKSQRNYNKKAMDDLYVKNLIKTDHCKVLSTNSLFNTLNMSYNFKLVRDATSTEDGVLTEEMLQLKTGIKPRRLNLYPEIINLQTVSKFIYNGRFYLHKCNRTLPVTTKLEKMIIDHKVLLSGIIKKFVLTTTPLIINDIHNISIYLEQYQSTLTTQLIRDYLKLTFLQCLDTDLETFLHAIFNMKYVLPITNLVQLTPDEFIINCYKFLTCPYESSFLEILPRRETVHSTQKIELSDCVYLINENNENLENLSHTGEIYDGNKPLLVIDSDSSRRYLSNRTEFKVLDNSHDLLVDLEKFKHDVLKRSSL